MIIKYNSAKVLKRVNILISLLIFLLSYAFLFVKLSDSSQLEAIEKFKLNVENFNTSHIIIIATIVLLMFVNWLIETLKWKNLMQKEYPLSWGEAIRATLLGVCVSFILPNRMGDFVGRAFAMPKNYALKGGITTLVSNFSQGLITIVVGCVGLLYCFIIEKEYSSYTTYYIIGLILLCFTIILMLIIYFNLSTIISFLQRFNNKLALFLNKKLLFLHSYSSKDLLKTLFLSFIRYFVFSVQLYLALTLFSYQLPIIPILLMGSIYFLISSFVPTWVLSEIGVRASVAIVIFGQCNYFFHSFGIDNINVVVATIFLWLINVVTPAIVGSFFVFYLKFFRWN